MTRLVLQLNENTLQLSPLHGLKCYVSIAGHSYAQHIAMIK